jgi:hypothetical protein
LKRSYYFLAASLPELVRSKIQEAEHLPEVLAQCARELHPQDFQSLKTLFLFNDIINAVYYRKAGDPFFSPSYYSEEEILAGRQEPGLLLPFLREFFQRSAAGTRRFPRLLEADEITVLFYGRLDDIKDAFVREYYLHELELRNIAVALDLRERSVPLEGKLIPTGTAYPLLLGSSAEDFGLKDFFPYLPKLLAAFQGKDLTRRERTLDDIRWEWLTDRIGSDFFSSHYIFAYVIKLLSLSRWRSLTDEAGRELFEELLHTVQRSVRFAIEFSKVDKAAVMEERQEAS